jgi:pSer/pThr/pTyr-binding forkhead associated (FHA) protein
MSGIVVLALRILLALALYAFLGLALWMLWTDLQRASSGIAGRPVPGILLELTLRQESTLRRFFGKSQVILGRDPTCDLAMPDPSVSARHAMLSYHHGQWWLDDLGSSNGTRLNQEELRTPTVLTTGDEIRCGGATVLFSVGPDGGLPEVGSKDGTNG